MLTEAFQLFVWLFMFSVVGACGVVVGTIADMLADREG